jgi:hypothetical protein
MSIVNNKHIVQAIWLCSLYAGDRLRTYIYQVVTDAAVFDEVLSQLENNTKLMILATWPAYAENLVNLIWQMSVRIVLIYN